VAHYWPGFGRTGKAEITARTLLGHRAGLPYLHTPLTLADTIDPDRQSVVLEAMESQPPSWTPGDNQGYHAITFGLYARELFERIADEDMSAYLRRRLLDPLDSDVWLGAPASLDSRVATLYPPHMAVRAGKMILSTLRSPRSTEARVFRGLLQRGSIGRRAFQNPSADGGVGAYNEVGVRRANLAWASATGSADGLARAYLPFAMRGQHQGRRYLSERVLEPVYRRLGWSERDLVLHKPIGWSQGFVKEEHDLFGPNPEAFGHPGMGGSMGWVDPIVGTALGYATNAMDWRIRSPRAVALCRSLYRCEPIIDG